MTWREKLVVRILLLIASLVADDAELRSEIRSLSTHVQVRTPEADLEVV